MCNKKVRPDKGTDDISALPPRFHSCLTAMALYYVLWQYRYSFSCNQRTIIRGSCNGELPWPLTDSFRAAVQHHVSEMIFCPRCTTGFHHTRLAMRLIGNILFLVINCVLCVLQLYIRYYHSYVKLSTLCYKSSFPFFAIMLSLYTASHERRCIFCFSKNSLSSSLLR